MELKELNQTQQNGKKLIPIPLEITNEEDRLINTHEAKASNLTSFIQILKSAVGLGLFILPHTAKDVGYLGFAIFYSVIVLTMNYFMVLLVDVANGIGYNGSSYGELHELMLGPRFRFISEFGIALHAFTMGLTYINAPSIFDLIEVELGADMMCYAGFGFFCDMGEGAWLLFCVLAFFLTAGISWIRNLKNLVFLNIWAVVAS